MASHNHLVEGMCSTSLYYAAADDDDVDDGDDASMN